MVYTKGNQGFVMLSDKQTALLTKKVPTLTGTIAAGEDLQLVKPQKQALTDRIRNRVAPSIVQKGKIHVEGSLTFDFIPNEVMGINLAMLLGSVNTVAGTSSVGYTHTFNAWSTATDFPVSGITIQKFLGGVGSTMLVDNIGCFVNSMDLTIPEDGVVSYAVNYMGIKNEYGGSKATPAYSAVAPFEGWMATLSIGAAIGSVAAVPFKDCTLNISNNLTMVTDHNASNQYPTAYIPNSRSVTMSVNVSQEDALTWYNYFKDDTVNAVQLVLTHPTLAGSASGVHSLTFKLPTVTWLGEEPKLDSNDALSASYNLVALWDTVTGYDVQAILVDGIAAVVSV
jgi:hypothetical protein